ncbi:MAG: hypothetical protein LBE72_05925 [Rickettsia sp.]|jgi:hypothetical protein|nr:hypothetical protein [Rickettsia sp.]
MKKNIKCLARKNTFIEFFSESLDHNKESEIKSWIQKHLIDKDPEVDQETKVGFFEAEKELLLFYLEKNNIEKMKQLFKVFDGFNNEGLRRIEFKIFTDIFENKRDLLVNHSEYKHLLKNVVEHTFDKLADKNDTDLIAKHSVIQTLLDESSLLGVDEAGPSS